MRGKGGWGCDNGYIYMCVYTCVYYMYVCCVCVLDEREGVCWGCDDGYICVCMCLFIYIIIHGGWGLCLKVCICLCIIIYTLTYTHIYKRKNRRSHT